MTIDLKLPSNEILHFLSDSVVMNERNQIPGFLEGASPFMAKSSPFVKRSQNRYDLNDFMNSKQGILNSAAPMGPSGRLDAESLHRLPGGVNPDGSSDG